MFDDTNSYKNIDRKGKIGYTMRNFEGKTHIQSLTFIFFSTFTCSYFFFIYINNGFIRSENIYIILSSFSNKWIRITRKLVCIIVHYSYELMKLFASLSAGVCIQLIHIHSLFALFGLCISGLLTLQVRNCRQPFAPKHHPNPISSRLTNLHNFTFC